MIRHLKIALLVSAIAAGTGTLAAESLTSDLRGSTPLDQEARPPAISPEVNASIRERRNYPEQPPLIPHAIEGYEISVNGNKCLSCHARSRVHESQAPMVSVTHFYDRDGQMLASISPRRYFCTQCHVPQHGVQPPVKNDFVDVDTLIRQDAPGARR